MLREKHNYMIINRKETKRKELDTRAVIVFTVILIIISATVCLMYQDVILDKPEMQLRYNFSDLVK
jgi:hypothetical protein